MESFKIYAIVEYGLEIASSLCNKQGRVNGCVMSLIQTLPTESTE